MNKKIIPIMIAVIIIAGAGGFYGGIKYGQSKNQNSARNMAGFFADSESGNGQQRMRIFAGENAGNIAGQRADGEFANGEILAKDEQSLTIKLLDWRCEIFSFWRSTRGRKNE